MTKSKQSETLFDEASSTAEQAKPNASSEKRVRESRQVAGPLQTLHEAQKTAPTALECPQPSAAITDYAGAMIEMMHAIERLAPQLDPQKLDAFINLQERIFDRQARIEFDRHFRDMQAELPIITKDGRISAKGVSKAGREYEQNTAYAKWDTAYPLIQPILHKHGFTLSHRTGTSPDGRIRVTAVLKGWGWIDDSTYLDGTPDTTGSKNSVQAIASTVSYLKRHTGFAALEIVTKDEDDDGNSAGKPKTVGEPLTAEQVDKLRDYMEATEIKVAGFLKVMNRERPKGHPLAERIEDLPNARFDQAMDLLREAEQTKRERRG